MPHISMWVPRAWYVSYHVYAIRLISIYFFIQVFSYQNLIANGFLLSAQKKEIVVITFGVLMTFCIQVGQQHYTVYPIKLTPPR